MRLIKGILVVIWSKVDGSQIVPNSISSITVMNGEISAPPTYNSIAALSAQQRPSTISIYPRPGPGGPEGPNGGDLAPTLIRNGDGDYIAKSASSSAPQAKALMPIEPDWSPVGIGSGPSEKRLLSNAGVPSDFDSTVDLRQAKVLQSTATLTITESLTVSQNCSMSSTASASIETQTVTVYTMYSTVAPSSASNTTQVNGANSSSMIQTAFWMIAVLFLNALVASA